MEIECTYSFITALSVFIGLVFSICDRIEKWIASRRPKFVWSIVSHKFGQFIVSVVNVGKVDFKIVRLDVIVDGKKVSLENGSFVCVGQIRLFQFAASTRASCSLTSLTLAESM